MKIKSQSDEALPSFEDPLSILLACHEKVRHFALLAQRLGAHVSERGADAEAAQAATSILRYFDLAAPLHHEDEEDDVFPALRALQDKQLDVAINSLEEEHADLAALWQSIQPWLSATARRALAEVPATLAEFSARYVAHANREECEAYPSMSHFSDAVIGAIGRSMRARRGARD